MSDTESSPVLTSSEAADFLRLPSVNAFYQMRKKFRQPRGFRLGRKLLFTRVELERLLRAQQKAAKGVAFEDLTPRKRATS